MNQTNKPLSDAELHALVDDQLDADQRAQLEARLAEHPEAAKDVRDYRAINRELHALYDSVTAESIPPRLLLGQRRRVSHWARAAAIAGWLAIGACGGWFTHAWLTPAPLLFTDSLIKEAALAHAMYTREVRHPVEVNADEEPHLVAWLSKRLNAQIRAPQLGGLGFELLGGRLLPTSSGPAAQFMYQDSEGERLTLFVRSGAGDQQDTAFHFAQTGGVHAFYWIDRDLGYALIGSLSKPVLTKAAHLVYEQLSY